MGCGFVGCSPDEVVDLRGGGGGGVPGDRVWAEKALVGSQLLGFLGFILIFRTGGRSRVLFRGVGSVEFVAVLQPLNRGGVVCV